MVAVGLLGLVIVVVQALFAVFAYREAKRRDARSPLVAALIVFVLGFAAMSLLGSISGVSANDAMLAVFFIEALLAMLAVALRRPTERQTAA